MRVLMGKKGSKLTPQDVEELTEVTHFPPAQLQKWYKDFIRDCPTGFMSKTEFSKIYGQFFPSGDPGKFVDYVFNVFDVNKDGVITFKEFIRAISVATKGTMEDKLNWAFNLYDLDNDGYVSQSEMLDIVRAIYRLHGKQNEAMPAEESPERRVQQLFAKLDVNKDGLLSREEFCHGFKNDPWITRALLGFAGGVGAGPGDSSQSAQQSPQQQHPSNQIQQLQQQAQQQQSPLKQHLVRNHHCHFSPTHSTDQA